MEALTTAYLQFRQPRVGGMSSDLPFVKLSCPDPCWDSSGGEDAPACELPLHADLAAPSEPLDPPYFLRPPCGQMDLSYLH